MQTNPLLFDAEPLANDSAAQPGCQAHCSHGRRGCTGCITGHPCAMCLARKALVERAALNQSVSKSPASPASPAGFTLIELLIVIGLLGALAMLVLPRLTVTKTWAVDESLAPSEMMDIRRAYAAFQADCLPTRSDATNIARYGLAILMTTNLWPNESVWIWSFPATFAPNRCKGWRGPYLQSEGERVVYIDGNGQPTAGYGSTCSIPVIYDPRHSMDSALADERFYRVLMRTNTLFLVYVGENGILDTNTDLAQPLETR
jgi:prepilin-type N-terminal cleavage/methylation domain-containing protein